MVLEIVCILIGVILSTILIHIAEKYWDNRKRVGMSFKEAMDLVELPIITFYNGGNKFNFLLDTGANMSVIDSNVLDNFPHEDTKDGGIVWGMEGNKINVNYVKASLEYKGASYEDTFQVVDMGASFKAIKEESGVTLSGILGSSFFKKYQYVLDFNELIAYSKR